jgi:methyltransferase family protein
MLGMLGPSDLVLDIGGGASPFPRADWVIDLMAYEKRGLYGYEDKGPERFGADTWIQRDICDREPYPFADKEIDFVICSHTLEDVRDPVWVCSEMNRIAKAGYIEVPSRLEEQSYGFRGPWVGWGHHHWLIDVFDGGIQFVFKTHSIHGRPTDYFPLGFSAALSSEERVQTLWWEGEFRYAERLMANADEVQAYLSEFVAENLGRHGYSRPGKLSRVLARLTRRR